MNATGTPEADWLRCAALSHAPEFSSDALLDNAGRLVVVAPQPDDETLSAGGLIAAAAERGCPIVIVVVTDGEARNDGSTRWTRAALTLQRIGELQCALTALDAANASVVRLRLKDSAVSAGVDTLASRLRQELRSSDVVVCPWRRDGHPDHEAVAAAVLAVAPALGCRILEAPIWMWHWRKPDCALIEWHRLLRVRLSAPVALRKAAALQSFTSQRERDPTLARTPIADESALAHFQRDFEAFFDHVA